MIHRIEEGKEVLVAGISERYTAEGCAAIPAQWQRFAPNIGHIPGEILGITYGVVYNGDDAGNIEYLSGVEVADFSEDNFTHLRIPAQRYAVFTQTAHISTIQQTWSAIRKEALRETGGPKFERYGEEFNPATGEGGFEIWIPVK